MVYCLLFFTAFISATVFPLGSEALLIYDIKEGYNLTLLLIFASLGNTLGSVINYYLGLKSESFLEKKKYLNEKSTEKYKKYFDKYGGFTLLLSWVPFFGDSITCVAGILKYDIKKFIFLVGIAKFLRYFILAMLIT